MPRFFGLPTTSLLSAALLIGCAEDSPTPQPPATTDVYQVRGVVKSLPNEGSPGSGLMVHHEAIPTFIGHTGEAEPMPEMTMGFPLGAGVTAEDLEIGDKIELRFEVTRGVKFEATEISPLADNTALELHGPGAGHDHHDH